MPVRDQNGVITHYTLYYRKEGSAINSNIPLMSSTVQANLTGLSIYTMYNIVVSASTAAGVVPVSAIVNVKTGEVGKLTDE